MPNILVATDFSPVAENAVAYAASIAKQFNAKLILFNAFKLSVHASNARVSAEGMNELFLENLNRLKEKTLLITKDYEIEVAYESSFSFVEDELENLLLKYEADLVVLGMAPKTVEQDLMGNTTTAAIKTMKIPVLAVPIGAKFNEIKRVLFACDVLRGVSVKVLESIKELASKSNAEVEVFFVDDRIEELKESQPDTLAENIIDDGLNGITYTHKNVQSNAVIKEIEKEIIEYKADLLIMIPKKYGFWASLVHKSKTRVMASGLEIPLLSIPL